MREHLYNRPLPFLTHRTSILALLSCIAGSSFTISVFNIFTQPIALNKSYKKKTVDCKEDNVPGIDEGAEDHGLNRQLVKNYR